MLYGHLGIWCQCPFFHWPDSTTPSWLSFPSSTRCHYPMTEAFLLARLESLTSAWESWALTTMPQKLASSVVNHSWPMPCPASLLVQESKLEVGKHHHWGPQRRILYAGAKLYTPPSPPALSCWTAICFHPQDPLKQGKPPGPKAVHRPAPFLTGPVITIIITSKCSTQHGESIIHSGLSFCFPHTNIFSLWLPSQFSLSSSLLTGTEYVLP